MAKMKTLTINGQKYTVDDPDAVQAVNEDDSIPEAGTVPTANGEGGVTWEKPSGGGTFYVTVTDSTADKTVDELLEAYNNGMTLVCLLNTGDTSLIAYHLQGVDTENKEVLFSWTYAFEDEAITIAYIIFTEDGIKQNTVSINEGDSLPSGSDGQFLTLSGGAPAWANLPEAEAELPTGGTDGQVLTLVSGSPAWADASGGGAGVMYVTGTYDGTNVTTDKTIDEICEAYTNGQLPVFTFNGVAIFHLQSIDTEAKSAVFSLNTVDSDGVAGDYVLISADGNQYAQVGFGPSDGLPTGGTAGQVLTVLEDDSVGWADPVATSAEGVLFG